MPLTIMSMAKKEWSSIATMEAGIEENAVVVPTGDGGGWRHMAGGGGEHGATGVEAAMYYERGREGAYAVGSELEVGVGTTVIEEEEEAKERFPLPPPSQISSATNATLFLLRRSHLQPRSIFFLLLFGSHSQLRCYPFPPPHWISPAPPYCPLPPLPRISPTTSTPTSSSSSSPLFGTSPPLPITYTKALRKREEKKLSKKPLNLEIFTEIANIYNFKIPKKFEVFIAPPMHIAE